MPHFCGQNHYQHYGCGDCQNGLSLGRRRHNAVIWLRVLQRSSPHGSRATCPKAGCHVPPVAYSLPKTRFCLFGTDLWGMRHLSHMFSYVSGEWGSLSERRGACTERTDSAQSLVQKTEEKNIKRQRQGRITRQKETKRTPRACVQLTGFLDTDVAPRRVQWIK